MTPLLLALTQVVAGSPFAGSELQAAALLLMLNLHGKIHRAVGAMWAPTADSPDTAGTPAGE